MVDRASAGQPDFDVVLVSNGFQAEYEIGFSNGLARCGLRPLLVCSDRLSTGRLDRGVTTLNLRGSQQSDRSSAQKTLNILRYWVQLFGLLRAQAGHPIHMIGLFTLPSTWVGLLEALALRLSSRHFVLTVHNVLPHGAHHGTNRWLYRLIYKLPHKLVVHTLRMSKTLQIEYGVSATRVVVMEHGIDRLAPIELANPQWLGEHLDLPAGMPVVLFFGSLSRYKGLDILVTALVESATALDAILVVAGSCLDTELRAKISPGLSHLVAQGRARWVDSFVPEDQVLNYFHGADVLVMPYRAIDQSGVVFMALATGLPVVATNVGSLADYVPFTGGQVVAPEDADGLLEGLRKVLASSRPADRSDRVRSASRFLWSQTVLAVLPAYGGKFEQHP